MLVPRTPSHDLWLLSHDFSGFSFISPFSSIVTLAWRFSFSGCYRSLSPRGRTVTEPVQVALAWRIVQDDYEMMLFFLSHTKVKQYFQDPLCFRILIYF
jgi:hypothetical protein